MADRGSPDVNIQPDHHTLPRNQPDFHTLPEKPDDESGHVTYPDIEDPITCFPPPTREDLENALTRAQLVVEDAANLLSQAIEAMAGEAWVSRTADEFSDGLETHARIAGDAAEAGVETIREALDTHGDDRPVVTPL